MDVALLALAAEQSDVVKRSQLNALGTTPSAIRAQISAGRWQPLGKLVVAMHNGPLTRQQREWATVLASGRDARLAGRTALGLAGLRGWEVDQVHILVPRGRTPPRLKNFRVVVHETRWTGDECLHTVGRPPRTAVERSAIDAARWSTRDRTACAVVAAVVQQRLTTPERLLALLDISGPIRYRRELRLALVDIAGGAEALSEIDFHRLCRRYKLGRVVGQKVRLDGEGRRRYLDGEIASTGGGRVFFEVDGANHLAVESYGRDMSRGNELIIAGRAPLRFTSIASRFEPAKVADQLQRALRASERRTATG